MKRIHIITLLLAVVTIGQQLCFAGQQQSFASRLTQESYISPEMQWDILYFLGAQELTLERTTGTVFGMQPVDVMLPLIYEKLQDSITPADKEAMKTALQSMLEATDIAIFVAAIEAAYKDQKFLLYQSVDGQITADLNAQKANIQAAMATVNKTFVPGEASSSWSLNSYLPWSISSNGSSNAHVNKNSTLQVPVANIIKIPAELMPTIVHKNSYKNMTDAKEAANLLFKQCFIAQQHHLYEDKAEAKNAFRIQQIKINLQNPISATNYIFNNFPNIDQICEIAKNSVARVRPRSKVQDPITFEHLQAHKLLLHIRQAVQTSIYIANAKSSYNVGSVLPKAVQAYLGGIVGQLLQYDAQLSTLCKDPRYGATTEDTYQDEQWAMITKIAAGVVVASVLYAATPVGTASAIAKGASSLVPTSWWGGSTQTPAVAASDTTQTPAVATESTLQKAWGYGKTAYDVASTAGAIGGALATTTGIVQYADTHGYIPLNQIDPNARYLVDGTNRLATGAAIVGGAGTAIGGIGGAVMRANDARKALLTGSAGLMDVVNAVNETKGIGNSIRQAEYASSQAAAVGMTGLGTAVQLAGLVNNPTHQNNPQVQNRNQQAAVQQIPTGQIPPQKLADGFAKIIATSAKNGSDASAKITEQSIKLLTDGKSDPAVLLNVLQYVQANNVESDPNLANNLGQFIEALAAEMSKAQ